MHDHLGGVVVFRSADLQLELLQRPAAVMPQSSRFGPQSEGSAECLDSFDVFCGGAFWILPCLDAKHGLIEVIYVKRGYFFCQRGAAVL